jgi:hypothetical protein
VKSLRWIAIEALLAATSIVFGWVIPDGLNRLAHVLGQPSATVDSTERLLSSMVVFLFTVSLQLMLFVRSEIRALQEQVPRSIDNALAQQTGPALDNSLLRVILDGIDSNPSGLRHTQALLRSIARVLARAHSYLRDAEAVIIERAVANAGREIELLSHEGLEVDIRDHIEVSRRLAEDAKSYLQIQRKVFLVPQDWTGEWMRFVASLPPRGTKCEYIVLRDVASMAHERKKLESMNDYLTKVGWNFYYCDLQDVLDSFGGILPTDWNLEIIDNKIAKLQDMRADKYQGGIKLRMLLYPLAERTDLQNFVHVVSQSAHRFPGKLFPSK